MSTDSTTLKKALDSEKHCDGALLELQALLSRLVKLKKHITAQRNFITDVVKSNITTSMISSQAKDNLIDYRVNEYKHDGIYFDISADTAKNVLSDVSTDSKVFRDAQKYSDPTLIEDAKVTGYDMEEVRKLLASLNALIGAPNDTVNSITDIEDNPAVSISDGVYDTTKILERAIYFLKSAFLSSDIGKYGFAALDQHNGKDKQINFPYFAPKSLTANDDHNVHGKYNIECANTVIVWRAIYSSLHSLNNMRFIEKAFPLNGTSNTDITVQLEHLFKKILTTKDDSDLDRWVCKNWAGQFKRDVLFDDQGVAVTGYTRDHFRSIPVSFLGKYALTTKSVYIVGKGDSAKFSPNTLTIQEGDTVTWHNSGTGNEITYKWETNDADNIINTAGGGDSKYVFDDDSPNDKHQTVTSGIFLTKDTYEYKLGTTNTGGTIEVLSREEYDIHMDKKMTEAASELALMFIYGGYRSGIYNHSVATAGITTQTTNSELFLQTSTTKPRYKADLNVIKSLIGYDASGNKGLEDVGITIPPLQPFVDAPETLGVSTGSVKITKFSAKYNEDHEMGQDQDATEWMGEITTTGHGLHTGDIVSLELVDGIMPTGFVTNYNNVITGDHNINRIVINGHGRSTCANTYMVHRINSDKITLHDYVGMTGFATVKYNVNDVRVDANIVDDAQNDMLSVKYNLCLQNLLKNRGTIGFQGDTVKELYLNTQLISWAPIDDTTLDTYGRIVTASTAAPTGTNVDTALGIVYIRKLGNGLTHPEQLLSTDTVYADNTKASKYLLNKTVMVGGNTTFKMKVATGSNATVHTNKVRDYADQLDTIGELNPENKRKRDEPDKNPVLLSLFWPIQKYYKTILTELQNLNLKHQIIEGDLKHQIIEGDVLKHRYNNSGITPNMIVRELIYQSEDATNGRVQPLILDKPINEPLLSKMVNANGTTASVIFSRHYNADDNGTINAGTGTATDVHIYTSKQHYKDMYNDKSSPGTGLIESAGITININAIDTTPAATQQPLKSLLNVTGDDGKYLIDKVAINVYDPVNKEVISGISNVINDVEILTSKLDTEGTKLTDIPDIPLYANQYLPIILRIGDANITSNSVYIRLFILYAPVASGTTDYPLWDLLADGTTVPVQLGSDVQSNVRNIYTNIQYKLSIDGTNGHIVLNNDQNSFIDEHTNSNDCYTVTKSSKVDYTISNGVIQDDALLTAYQVGTKIVNRWQVVRFNSLIKEGTTELPRIMRIKITGSDVELARLENTTNINTSNNLSLVDSSVMTPTFELQTPDVTGGTLTTLGLYANTEVTRDSDKYLWTDSTTIASKIENPFKMVITQSGLDRCADIINDISTVEMKTKLQKAYTQFKNDAGRNTAGIRGLDIN